jgi:hypothetical protein
MFVALEGAKHGGPEFISPESNQAFLEFFTKNLK